MKIYDVVNSFQDVSSYVLMMFIIWNYMNLDLLERVICLYIKHLIICLLVRNQFLDIQMNYYIHILNDSILKFDEFANSIVNVDKTI